MPRPSDPGPISWEVVEVCEPHRQKVVIKFSPVPNNEGIIAQKIKIYEQTVEDDKVSEIEYYFSNMGVDIATLTITMKCCVRDTHFAKYRYGLWYETVDAVSPFGSQGTIELPCKHSPPLHVDDPTEDPTKPYGPR